MSLLEIAEGVSFVPGDAGRAEISRMPRLVGAPFRASDASCACKGEKKMTRASFVSQGWWQGTRLQLCTSPNLENISKRLSSSMLSGRPLTAKCVFEDRGLRAKLPESIVSTRVELYHTALQEYSEVIEPQNAIVGQSGRLPNLE